jgi:hypothetical protein
MAANNINRLFHCAETARGNETGEIPPKWVAFIFQTLTPNVRIKTKTLNPTT